MSNKQKIQFSFKLPKEKELYFFLFLLKIIKEIKTLKLKSTKAIKT